MGPHILERASLKGKGTSTIITTTEPCQLWNQTQIWSISFISWRFNKNWRKTLYPCNKLGVHDLRVKMNTIYVLKF